MPSSSRGARLKYGAVFTFYCRRCICLQAVLRVNEYSVEPHLLGLTGAGKIAYGACQGRRDKAALREDCFWKIVEAAYAARARIFFTRAPEPDTAVRDGNGYSKSKLDGFLLH